LSIILNTKKYHIVGTVPKSNGKIDVIALTHICISAKKLIMKYGSYFNPFVLLVWAHETNLTPPLFIESPSQS
jgi:hypothetical protein